MQLLEIHIYGYGKLEDVHFMLDEFTVFFGENEAGKSTIMSFIHSILFGFPTKQQTELRYEPKSGAKYGGKIIASFPKYGKVVIERVKGRAIGDVSVHLEDGTVGGEELLRKLLGNIDKSFYQAIFSFNLHGLQNVHLLKAEEVGRYLFSTGTFGTGLLLQVEEKLKKEITNRFKPTGRKPLINEKLKTINHHFEELKKQEEKNLQYVSFINEKKLLQEKMVKLKEERELLQERKNKLEEWMKIAPVYKERNYLLKEIEENDFPFPQDGMERLEQFNQFIYPLIGQRKSLIEKEANLQKELEATVPNHDVLQNEYTIHQLSEKQTLVKVYDEEIKKIMRDLEQNQNEFAYLQDKLHLSLTDEQILAMDTSVFLQQEVEEGDKKRNKLLERREELEEQHSREKNALEQLEEQMEQVQRQLLPKEEKRALVEKIESFKGKEAIEKELQFLEDKKQILLQTVKQEKRDKKKSRWQQVILATILLFLTGYSFFQQKWLFFVGTMISLLIVIFFFFQKLKEKETKWDKEILKIEKERERLINELETIEPTEIPFLNETLRKNELLEKEGQRLEIKLEQQKVQYEQVIASFTSWEKEFFAHEEKLRELRKRLQLPETIPFTFLNTAYQMVVQMKELLREQTQLKKQIKLKTKFLTEIENEIHSLYQRYSSYQECNLLDEMVFFLKQLLAKEKKKLQHYEIIKEKLSEIKEQLEDIKKRLEHLEEEKKKLFQQANVQSEEEFRTLAQHFMERQKKLQRLEELTKQLSLSSLKIEELKSFAEMENGEKEILQTEERIVNIKEEEEELYQKLADVHHQISLIEEGGTYGEKLHTYKQFQSELIEEAYHWAKFTVAKTMLKRTVDRFQHIRLPKMIEKAEEYLIYLTEGNYQRIIIDEKTDAFLIESKDHTLFQGMELSQATMEQVYVAIRLALVDTLYKRFTLPILIDDSFVNFDKQRTKRVMELIRQMKRNQVLFFTCHEHLISYFQSKEIIQLDENRAKFAAKKKGVQVLSE